MVPADDLARLAPQIAAVATVLANGEVSWPVHSAEAAINALADAGFVILGLDVREHDHEGRFVETPWSVYEPNGTNDVEQAREAALEALRHRDRGDTVLITWDHAL